MSKPTRAQRKRARAKERARPETFAGIDRTAAWRWFSGIDRSTTPQRLAGTAVTINRVEVYPGDPDAFAAAMQREWVGFNVDAVANRWRDPLPARVHFEIVTETRAHERTRIGWQNEYQQRPHYAVVSPTVYRQLERAYERDVRAQRTIDRSVGMGPMPTQHPNLEATARVCGLSLQQALDELGRYAIGEIPPPSLSDLDR